MYTQIIDIVLKSRIIQIGESKINVRLATKPPTNAAAIAAALVIVVHFGRPRAATPAFRRRPIANPVNSTAAVVANLVAVVVLAVTVDAIVLVAAAVRRACYQACE